MYDHIRDLPKSSRIDLFLYSRGGAIEVPWRMITMLREHCNHLSVLIPYRALSAATLIALGCDEIVMGGKAELGPIDPALIPILNELSVKQSCFYWTVTDISIDERIHTNSG
jgi:ClpP class serine protease